MKKFKNKIILTILAVMLSSICFLFAPSQKVYANSNYESTQSDTKSIDKFESNSNTMEYSLASSDYAQSCYNVKVEDNNASIKSNPTITFENNLIKITSETTILHALKNHISTNLKIGNSLVTAFKNNALKVSFQVKVVSDNENKHSVTISSGSFSQTKESSSKNGEVLSFEFTDLANDINFSVVSNSKSDAWRDYKNILHVESLKLNLTKLDTTAPSITQGIIENANVWGNSKKLSWLIEETQSGLASVNVNGENKLSELKDGSIQVLENGNVVTKTGKILELDAQEDKDYTIFAVDNVNNQSEKQTITKEEIKVDKTGFGKLDNKFNNVKLDLYNVAYVKDNFLSINVNPNLDKTKVYKSSDRIYYSIVEFSEEELSNKTNKPSINSSSFELISEIDATTGNEKFVDSNISLTKLTECRKYILYIMAIDEAKNESDIYTQIFWYDPTPVKLNLSSVVNAKISSIVVTSTNNVSTTYTSDFDNIQIYHGDDIVINFEGENQDYTFYKCEITKGEASIQEKKDDRCVLTCGSSDSGDIYVGIKFRFKAQIVDYTQVYDYNFDNNYTLNYTFNDENIKNASDIIFDIKYYKITDGVVDSLPLADLELNAGDYLIKWSLESESYIGSGEFNITIAPKELTLTYGLKRDISVEEFEIISEQTHITFDGIEKSVIVDLSKLENLSAGENQVLDFQISYSLDGNPTSLLNAGKYIVTIISTNPNYIVSNNIFELEINKIKYSIEFGTTNFEYNAQEQNIDWKVLDGENQINFDAVEIVFNNDPSVKFENVGSYTVSIFPIDKTNYEFENNECELTIEVSYVTIELQETKYGYLGRALTIDDLIFVAKNSSGNTVNVKGLKLSLDNDSIAKDEGDYVVSLVTDDLGYVLNGNTDLNINIYRNSIKIVVTKNYEYTSENIKFDYKLINKNNNEILSSIENVSLNIFKDGNLVKEIVGVGTYTYVFSTLDPLFELFDENDISAIFNNETNEYVITGEFVVTTANLNITFENSTYEYCDNSNDKYSFNYSVVSANGIDFKNNSHISYNVYFLTSDENGNLVTEDTTCEFGARGLGYYLIKFKSDDENIIISNQEFQVEIIKRTIEINIQNEYTYGDTQIVFEFADGNLESSHGLNKSEISINASALSDVGEYVYVIESLNENYQIVVINAIKNSNDEYYVVVNKKEILVTNISTEGLTYTGSAIRPKVEFNCQFDEYVVVDINGSDIINAGEYLINILSTNSNYSINLGQYSQVKIVISKKLANLSVSGTTKTYNACGQSLDLQCIVDGVDTSLQYKITFTNIQTSEEFVFFGNYDEEKINNLPISVGRYLVNITIEEQNYEGNKSCEFEIIQKEIELKIASGQFKIYLSEEPQIKYTLVGVEESDILTTHVSLSRTTGENVGIYKIKYNGINNANYIVKCEYVDDSQSVGVFEIKKKNISVIASSSTKKFGEPDPVFTYKIYDINSTLISESELYSYIKLTRTITDSSEDVGKYDIVLDTQSQNGEYLEFIKNYNIDYMRNYLTITPRTINVCVENISKIYGESDPCTYLSNDSIITFVDPSDSAYVVDTKYINGKFARALGENVGVYDINIGDLSSTNYKLNFVGNSTLTITKRPIIIQALGGFKRYGTSDKLDYVVVGEGLLISDTLVGSLQREQGENVGSYQINLGTLHNDNYEIIRFYEARYEIIEAKLDVTIDDLQQVYGQQEKSLTYTCNGLMFGENIEVKLYRNGDENVGEYSIIAKAIKVYDSNNNETTDNYIIKVHEGIYSITKAKVNINITPKTYIYSGKPYFMTCDNFDGQLEYIYTLRGNEVKDVVDCGVYKVVAIFKGNHNYEESKSNETTLEIKKQWVYITIVKNEFVYDGSIKYPEYSFDKTIGLDQHKIVMDFKNNVLPREVNDQSGYEFVLRIDDENFEGYATGVVKIKNAFTVKNSKNSILECADATFDENAQNVNLKQSNKEKKFNNEKVLSVCTLENADAIKDSGYVYTVKVKATAGVNNVKVYKVGLDGFNEIAIRVEDGFYVFMVDDLDDKYIITTEFKTLSTTAWIIILVLVALAFTITLIVVAKKKHKKLAVKDTKEPKSSDKDIETYNIN